MKKAPESELPGANGGEEGIRTLARLFAGYRISSADPSTTWVPLRV